MLHLAMESILQWQDQQHLTHQSCFRIELFNKPPTVPFLSNSIGSRPISNLSVLLKQNALFMVGEIDGNDYNYAFPQGKTLDEARTLVPHAIHQIVDVANKLIDLGAARLVVPGNSLIGCMPMYQTLFLGNVQFNLDENYCLVELSALDLLRTAHPEVSIIYADYYSTCFPVAL